MIYQAKAVQKVGECNCSWDLLYPPIWMFKSSMSIRFPLSVVIFSSTNAANSLHDSRILVDGI